MPPDYVTFSNLIIDDIVLSDGRTFMATLGGSGTHALVGMRVWSDRLGFVASRGSDFGAADLAQLESIGIDVRGVVDRGDLYQTARAWQLFEADERRIEVLRTDFKDFHHFTPRFEEMPPDYLQARGFHIQWGQSFAELNGLLDQLKSANPDMSLVWEPVSEHLNGSPEEYQTVFSKIDLISPDREEATHMTGQTTIEGMVETLLEWGVPRVAVRMGAEGSQVYSADDARGWRIPAVPAEIVDVTGAGDAYCGGFLVGIGEGLNTLEAALRAAVSASFALEQFGVPDFNESSAEKAERRLGWARDRVEAL